jgi:hypothetical protein
MKQANTIFESGATSHAVNDLILFTDNTRQTNDLMHSIYKDWHTAGTFGTGSLLDKFIPLFELARKHYINEFKDKGAGHIIRMTKEEIKEYCKLYVDDFNNWKKENGYN